MASTRRLAAIMFTDTVGYTASSQANEGGTLELLRQQVELVRPLVAIHQGREIKSTGDGFLVEFDSALKATQCAVNIQRRIHERNTEGGLAPIQIRIGIHLGDIVQRGTDILGDAVNIAARIEPVAEPGGICVSGAVHEQIRNKIPDKFEKLAPTALKGVQLPVDIYRLVLPWNVSEQSTLGRDPASLERSRLAVLPFVSMSPDPNDEYFADGLTEELIESLSHVKGLKVIARTSVMDYKKKQKHVSEIGKELGVGTIVEGSVRKAANRIRVTVQMIDVVTEEHLWASKYDDDLDDVFAVQSDIATKVAASLSSNFSIASIPVPVLKENQNLEAYLLFLQGQALAWKREEVPLRQALRFFEQAVQADPTFARGYASAARAYKELGNEGLVSWTEALAQGKAAAKKALSIDPNLAEGHCALAELMFMGDDPFSLMEREASRALELNPSLADAHDVLGQIAGVRGDLKAYVAHMEDAYRLDPLSPLAIRYLGRAYFLSGRYEEALDHWKRTLHFDPINSYRGMTDYYVIQGDLDTASSMVKEMQRVMPTARDTYLSTGVVAALKGDKSTAMQMIAKLDATHEKGWVTSPYAGYV
ncbi:MAG: adenylate/guanylate cyclase domain-containing protein, partial [Thermoplasmata archaeon]